MSPAACTSDAAAAAPPPLVAAPAPPSIPTGTEAEAGVEVGMGVGAAEPEAMKAVTEPCIEKTDMATNDQDVCNAIGPISYFHSSNVPHPFHTCPLKSQALIIATVSRAFLPHLLAAVWTAGLCQSAQRPPLGL